MDAETKTKIRIRAARKAAHTRKWRQAASKAKETGRWAKTMSKWLITFSSRGKTKWQIASFEGQRGGEAKGIIDFIAVRKDFSACEAPFKPGDLLEIVLIQSKGGTAGRPSQEDVKRLLQVAAHHSAKNVVLMEWLKGKVPKVSVLDGSGWREADPKLVFG